MNIAKIYSIFKGYISYTRIIIMVKNSEILTFIFQIFYYLMSIFSLYLLRLSKRFHALYSPFKKLNMKIIAVPANSNFVKGFPKKSKSQAYINATCR